MLLTPVLSWQRQWDVYAADGAEAPDPADYGIWVPGIPVLLESGLDAIGCADWLKGLILDGIVAGVLYNSSHTAPV